MALRERSTALRYLEVFRNEELRFLWWLRRDVFGQKLGLSLRRVISMSPTRDISAATTVAFCVGIVYSGFHFTMACVVNFGAVLFLRVLIAAKRPVEHDAALRQLADRARGNYPFPSVETHMACVVFGQLAASYTTQPWCFLVWVAAVLQIGLVAFSRLVAASRFPHQVVLSAATGSLGAVYARQVVDLIPQWRDGWTAFDQNRPHAMLVIFAAALALGVMAHFAEDNSSHFLSIPNEEFLRVMHGIYEPKGAPKTASKNDAPPDSLALLSARLSARGGQTTLG